MVKVCKSRELMPIRVAWSGVIKSTAMVRVIRDGVIIYDGKVGSLQREKDSVKEVKQGFECGITLTDYSDIKEGDIIESYEMQEVKRWR